MGDLNDYLLADLDRWSNKPSTNREQRGKVLNPLRNKGFEDAFRTTHPYLCMFSRYGNDQLVDVDSDTTFVKITNTRIDHILTSFANTQKLECIAILDNFNTGSDHRSVMASLQVIKNIPHVASANKEMAVNGAGTSSTNRPLPEQPKVKYIKHKENAEKWWAFSEAAQHNLQKNQSIVNNKLETCNDIEEWTSAFEDIMTDCVANNLQWTDSIPTKSPKNTNAQPEQSDTKHPAGPKPDNNTIENKLQQSYCTLPEKQMHKQPLLKYKAKLT